MPANHVVYWRDARLPYLETRAARLTTSPFGLHAHESFSLVLVEEGSTTFRYRGGARHIGAGGVAVILPGEPHVCNPSPGESLVYRNFFIGHDLVDEIWAEYAGSSLDLARMASAAVVDGDLARTLGRLWTLLHGPAEPLARDEFLSDALRRVLTVCLSSEEEGGRSIGTPSGVRAVLSRLRADMGEQPTLGDLALTAGMSRCHFLRVFRKAVGMTPYAYQTQLRVDVAKRLLVQGQAIADVALEAGFCDQSHLNRVFKRYVGATPRQYQSGC